MHRHEGTCESLGAVTRRERELAPLPLVPRSIIDRVKSLPSRVPVCDATSQVKRKFNETSPRGISRLARTKDAIYTSKKRNGTRRYDVYGLHRRRKQSTFPRGKITHVLFFLVPKGAKGTSVPPVTFERVYTSARHSYIAHCSPSSPLVIVAPICLRLRVLQKGPGERRKERRLVRRPKGGIPDFVRRSCSIAGRTDARRQHHRGCPGRRFGYPAPSVGMRTHARLTVPRSKYI